MVSLNNAQVATASYIEANTVRQGGTVRVNLQVGIRSNVAGSGSIYLSLADDGNPSGTSFLQETFYGPGLYSLERKCSGARVRGATAAGAAVTIELLQKSDLGE